MAIQIQLVAPDRASGREGFSAAADKFASDLPPWTAEVNALQAGVNLSEANAKASEVLAVGSADVALVSANFKGPWVPGEYTRPATVAADGTYWILLAATTTGTPGESADWGEYDYYTKAVIDASIYTKAEVDALLVDTDTGWIEPTLLAGWSTYSAGLTAPFGYRKLPSGLVVLRGDLKGGTRGATIFQLPVGFRPEWDFVTPIAAKVTALNYGNSTLMLYVTDTGAVVIYADETGTDVVERAWLNSSFMAA